MLVERVAMSAFTAPAWAGSEAPSDVCLVVLKDGLMCELVEFKPRKPFLVFGQDKRAADIFLNNLSAGPAHAVMVWDTRGALFVMDLDSEHGTFVNGDRIRPNARVKVTEDDAVVFAKSSREFRLHSDLARAREELEEAKQLYKKRKEERGTDADASKRKHAKKEGAPSKPKFIRVRHLLVKHRDSRNPSSWKNEHITISKDEAEDQLRMYIDELRDAEASNELESKFKEMASKHSDCSSYKRGGDLGPLDPAKFDKIFVAAALELKVNQLSGVVFTNSGAHVILRIE
ncbi:Peptidyl-prolyl cis-trans isomerase NIMA-interacting 1 [Porphyridium purpureum]|uniref:Peptidyl-prolyl cis-trans isomerase n=1 Tax=Porphyridium purpureum TaxID=35688 RepID=A0A5J4Z0Z7_PORPP|nr:Peptidyl-prolyl cis-trans isomerase NIMA-interacting 1 [Porphyridium purpureum]|eukprot:POR4898..scf295_1